MELTIAAMELEVLVDFLEEALEHLEGIEEKILQLESSQDLELVNSIFRPAHTIKGTASFLGLNDVKYLSHELETLLDDLRNDKITVSAELIDTLLEGVDILAQMLKEVQKGVDNADQKNDPVIVAVVDIDFDDELAAVAELKDAPKDKPKSQKQDSESPKTSQTESAPLLSSDELKAISYPMDMDAAYVQESREHLDNLERCLLDLEVNPQNYDLYNDIFRDLHSLKGGAGVLVSTVEPVEIRSRHPIRVFQDLAHAAEGLVQGVRDSKTELPPDALETLLTATDRLKYILDGFVAYDASTAQADDIIAACNVDPSNKNAAPAECTGKQSDPENDQTQAAQSFALANTLSQAISAIEAGIDELEIKEKRHGAIGKITRSLNMIAKVNKKNGLAGLPESGESILNIVDFLRHGEKDSVEALISGIVAEFKVFKQLVLDKIDNEGELAPASLPPSLVVKQPVLPKSTVNTASDSPHPEKASMSMIKVPQERLDILMNLVGELIVSKSGFPAIAREIVADHNLPEIGKKVKSAGEQVGRITEELQNIVMKMRMLPVVTVFSKFKRLVRDLAKKLDKIIVLKLSGEETELDKTIIETLGDPMVHLIRNCADHALEGSAERKKSGKSPEGTILLKAYNQGQNVIVEIVDDGRGIDPNHIRAKAIEKGYLSLEELEKLDDFAVQNLIFRPGFSGAREVTEVSGRGVGMDVVRTNVEKIGGVVSLRSKVGQGTTITITLPLTLAVSKGLEVKAAGLHYYLPLDYIIETVKLAPDMIRHHKNSKMAVVRGNLLPVFSLSDLLVSSKQNNYQKAAVTEISLTADKKVEEVSMVVLNMNGKKAALCVDSFYTEREYVIKPLSGTLAKIPGLSGATITSSGQVILILDPLKLF